MPVHTTMSQYSFAYKNSSCGIIPIVVPPYSFAPLHADSITPPSPPQISTAPADAISLPTSYAILLAMSVHLSLLYPITAICSLRTGLSNNQRLNYSFRIENTFTTQVGEREKSKSKVKQK